MGKLLLMVVCAGAILMLLATWATEAFTTTPMEKARQDFACSTHSGVYKYRTFGIFEVICMDGTTQRWATLKNIPEQYQPRIKQYETNSIVNIPAFENFLMSKEINYTMRETNDERQYLNSHYTILQLNIWRIVNE